MALEYPGSNATFDCRSPRRWKCLPKRGSTVCTSPLGKSRRGSSARGYVQACQRIARTPGTFPIRLVKRRNDLSRPRGTRDGARPHHCHIWSIQFRRRKRVMMDSLPEGLAKWHRFVSEQDMQALSEALAEDVLLRSPVLWKPKEDKATVLLYLSSVARVLEDFTYHRQFVGDYAVVLEFSAHVGSMSLKGVDILQFNDAGQISEFEVMVRPANGLQALGAAMAQQLASTTQ